MDALVESNGALYLVVSCANDGYTTELDALADDRLTQVCAWPVEARYLVADNESIQLIMPNESSDSYQIVTLTTDDLH